MINKDTYKEDLSNRQKVNNGFVVRFELLGVIIALIIQTLTAVWWGATVTTKMDFMQEAVASLKTELNSATYDRYTVKEATKDFSVVNDRISRIENRVTTIENKQRI